MGKLQHEIWINSPLEKVWNILADLEAVQHYNPVVTKARYISSNRKGIGAARQCDFKPKGYGKERVIEWKPNEVIGIELYEHQWPVRFMRWRTRLQPDGTGVLVTQDLEYEMKFGVLGKLMDTLMMRRKLDQGISEIFKSMKQHIETGAKRP